MGTHVSVSLILILLSIVILSGHAQLCAPHRRDSRYTTCDHTTPVCECEDEKLIDNVCRFCFEIEQRHTFTRYLLDTDDIEIPGYGGRVWYFNSTGQLDELPPEPNDMPSSCVNNPNCTDAYTTDGNSFRLKTDMLTNFEQDGVPPAPTLIVPNANDPQ